ncbi:MAG: phasin family protein [Methanohalobium sp.]|uniref:phasin family protein n=1 Tax=Methanohalobium sp. TaxID=2837493 RepID=UPI003978ACB9
MIESMKKLALMGIGAWALTEEKINETVEDLVQRGELSREEGKKLINEMIAERRKQKEDIENKISEKVQETFKEYNLATKDDYKNLEEKLNQLQSTLDELKEKK